MIFSNSTLASVSLQVCKLILLWTVTAMLGCGGGGGGGDGTPAPRPVINSALSSHSSLSAVSSSVFSSSVISITSSSSSSSLAPNLLVSGQVTYDFVPHTQDGLSYGATAARPGRGLLVELLNESNVVIATTLTDTGGMYSFSVSRNTLVKVRVKAQLLRNQSPGWNFKVTDNTNNNSLYSMVGSLVAVTEASAVRNLHAASGWTRFAYGNPRVAAPFAILDSVYEGIARIQATGNLLDFPALELRWSTKNKAAEGDIALGEIGTSFFNGDAIYILGDENNDTDEYDRHVVLHEWGHYVEAAFSRSDSLGGDHTQNDKLDMRVAMSEGFANAFSAMMLDDANYRDSSGQSQSDGFSKDVSNKNHNVRGWYSEGSVQSILYNFYTSNSGKTARNFADLFQVINASDYKDSSAFTSIYVFAEQLRASMPGQATFFNTLLTEQNISITNEYGEGESNSGGFAGSLPVYKNLLPGNLPVNVCSTNRFGAYNKLAVAQYFVVNITTAGSYQFSVQEAGEDSGTSDPDLYLYRQGSLIAFAEGVALDQESLSHFLPVGTHILELVDARMLDANEAAQITACFDVRVQKLN